MQYIVICRRGGPDEESLGSYVLSTRKVFPGYSLAQAHMEKIQSSRQPIIVACELPIPTTLRPEELSSGVASNLAETSLGQGYYSQESVDKHLQGRLDRRKRNQNEAMFAEGWASLASSVLSCLLEAPGAESENPTLNREELAATLMQWLGSPLGMGFLGDCLQRCGFQLQLIEERDSSKLTPD